jgi:hypothetical protein
MRARIRSIAKRIISDSFPSLQGKRIFFIVTWFRFYALSLWVPPALRFIIISTRTKSFSDEIITGILAHELSHQERYLEMGAFKYLGFAIRFIFSRIAQEKEEKATDRLTIEKGYGKYLYEVTLLSNKDRHHHKINNNYLTPVQIKSYAEELGKW